MIPFSEGLRYHYPDLTPDSIVLDIGAHEGNWGRLICEQYGCRVHLFEPIKQFYDGMQDSFAKHPKRDLMMLHPFGVGGNDRQETFKLQGVKSGFSADGPEESVRIIGIMTVLGLMDEMGLDGRDIDCLKINAEGSEYEILEKLLFEDEHTRFKRLQIQPHSVVPDALKRWANIRSNLLEDFNITAEDPQMDCGWLLLERK